MAPGDPPPGKAAGAIVVASNRGPVSFSRVPGGDGGVGRAEGPGLSARRGSGGLVSALRPIMEGGRGTWIATAMGAGDMEFARASGEAQDVVVDGAMYRLRYLPFDEATYRMAYDVISNGLFWFAAHGLFDAAYRPRIGAEIYQAWNEGYLPYNAAFASAIAGELVAAGRGPVAFIHDYHLMPAARMIRASLPDARLGYFAHTPFPTPEMLGHIPDAFAADMLDGVLACDLVGFHTPRWARRFTSCCQTLLGAEADEAGRDAIAITHAGRTTRIQAFPLGPDAGVLADEAGRPSVAEAAAALGVDLGGAGLGRSREDAELTIVRVDRLEPAKNTLRGFWAFDLLLARRPDLRGRVRYLAMLHPSRERMPEYRAYESECREAAQAVNRRWGDTAQPPVLLDIEDSYPRSLAALRRYDVLLVNSISDGMNLVAQEGPLINDRDGVVILSKNAGAADVLGDAALLVNPFDIAETADAMARALDMPPEDRAQRAAILRERASAHPPSGWLDGQLEALG